MIRLRDGEYYLVLKKRLDGTCIFNKWVGDKLVCSVHPVKPNVCRYYPFIYWLDGGVIKFEVYDKALGYCPGINKGGYANFRVEISSIEDAIKTKAEFKEIINKWNDLFKKGLVKGTLEEFMQYIEQFVDEPSRKNP